MMMGKIGDASKNINNEDSVKGVHQLSPQIKQILQEKHPNSRNVDPETILLPQDNDPVQPVIYEAVTSETI